MPPAHEPPFAGSGVVRFATVTVMTSIDEFPDRDGIKTDGPFEIDAESIVLRAPGGVVLQVGSSQLTLSERGLTIDLAGDLDIVARGQGTISVSADLSMHGARIDLN